MKKAAVAADAFYFAYFLFLFLRNFLWNSVFKTFRTLAFQIFRCLLGGEISLTGALSNRLEKIELCFT